MRKRRTRAAFAFAFAALALVAAAAGGVCAGADPPVVRECANPALPRDILNGSFEAAHPMRVVDVRAPAENLRLAVAADARSRELGLMCVKALRPRTGMIFVFPSTQYWDFWMKNTLAPLDMVWLDDTGVVTNVASDVPASTRRTPDTEVARRLGFGRYTLELPAGEAQLDGLVPGAKVRLPPLRASR